MQKMNVGKVMGEPVVWERFDSVSELLRVTEGRDYHGRWRDDHRTEGESYEDGVGNELSIDESHRLALSCDDRYESIWREVSSKVSKQIALSTYAPASRSKMDVVGGSVNVARAMAGHPRAFSRRTPDRRPKKVVRIAFGASCRWYYDTEDRMRNGITVLAIVDRLERAGYSVQLDLLPNCSHNGCKGGFSICEVALKTFSSPVNVRKLQFPMAAKATLFHLGCYWQHRSGSPYDSAEGRDIAYHCRESSLREFRSMFRSHDTVLLTNGMVDEGLETYMDGDVYGNDIELIQAYIEQEIGLIAQGK